MWRTLNAENKILKYTNTCSQRKSSGLRNPCFCWKSGGFMKSLRLQKIRWIYKILAFTENQADDRILASIEIPAPGKKTRVWRENRRDWKSRRPAYCLGSAESLTADFFLVWLMSSCSGPRRCDESRMQSPSEEKAQAALLLWAALSRTVPAVCTGPPCQEMAISTLQPKVRRPLGIVLIGRQIAK